MRYVNHLTFRNLTIPLISINGLLHLTRRSWRSRGFTQVEIFVIVAVIGVMAAIATPSLGGMLEAARMNQATTELRSAFQETQRYSIRKNASCQTNVLIPGSSKSATEIRGTCLPNGNRTLPKGIGIATNIVSSSSSTSSSRQLPSNVRINYAGPPGLTICASNNRSCDNEDKTKKSNSGQSVDSRDNISDDNLRESEIVSNRKVQVGFGRLGGANFDIVQSSSSSTPSRDSSAKFVSYRHREEQGKKSCIVISRSLGLTRIGSYDGSLSPSAITAEGTCKVKTWSKQ